MSNNELTDNFSLKAYNDICKNLPPSHQDNKIYMDSYNFWKMKLSIVDDEDD